MQICRYCQNARPDTDFEVCRTVGARVYRRRRCRDCLRALKNARRARLRVWIDEFKRELACERCGFNDFRALDFHHRSDSGKVLELGDLSRHKASVEKLLAEIAKCEILCA